MANRCLMALTTYQAVERGSPEVSLGAVAAECGIRVADSHVQEQAQRSMLMVRRFDRTPDDPVHFILQVEDWY